tara:strand:- start:552 stop:1295 length:744 start_codon:yes stop_codon:yes gene_type:complete
MINEQKKYPLRIAKFIAQSGIASRRQAEKMILEKRVEVDGEIISSAALNINKESKVRVDGREIYKQKKLRVWSFFKPDGVIVTNRDNKNRKTIYDILPKNLENVISIGRLDINSEGLILLTNSGEFARYLELPVNNFERQYKVRVHGDVDFNKINLIEKGITIDGVSYSKNKITIGKKTGANSWLSITLREGKNREIRKLFKHIDLSVNRLLRVSYGPFKLNDMKKGELREISSNFLKKKYETYFYL